MYIGHDLLETMNPSSILRVVWCLAAVSLTAPAAIVFEVHDLPDTSGGGDRWEYRYTLSNVEVEAGQGFSIFFDRSRYRDLEVGILDSHADWSLISIQPDHALLSAGFFDGQALVDGPSVGPFSVAFEWNGSELPGPQPFTFYDSDFSELSSGQTRVVPEPETSLVLLLACSLWSLRRHRH